MKKPTKKEARSLHVDFKTVRGKKKYYIRVLEYLGSSTKDLKEYKYPEF